RHVAAINEEAGDAFDVVRLGTKVELAQNHVADFAINAVEAVVRDEVRDDVEDTPQCPEIALHNELNVWVLNLDGDRLAAVQPGAMDLADRRRGDRLFLEVGK